MFNKQKNWLYFFIRKIKLTCTLRICKTADEPEGLNDPFLLRNQSFHNFLIEMPKLEESNRPENQHCKKQKLLVD